MEGEDLSASDSAQKSPRRRLPSFNALWSAFPDGDPEAVKAEIGGRVDAGWIENTCTIRLSHALNEAGFLIPKGPSADVEGLHTISGENGNQYAYRVREMESWLRQTIGQPTLTRESKGSAGVDPSAFSGRRGIIMFEVDSWSNASGHMDLWRDDQAKHAAYFEEAQSVSLWELD